MIDEHSDTTRTMSLRRSKPGGLTGSKWLPLPIRTNDLHSTAGVRPTVKGSPSTPAHCGGGTAACLASAGLTDRVQHLDIYTSSFDLYRPVGPDDVLARGGDTDEEYLSDVAILLSSIDWEQADLVLYNAGMDPHPGISAEALAHRERLMFEQAVALSSRCTLNDTQFASVRLMYGFGDHHWTRFVYERSLPVSASQPGVCRTLRWKLPGSSSVPHTTS